MEKETTSVECENLQLRKTSTISLFPEFSGKSNLTSFNSNLIAANNNSIFILNKDFSFKNSLSLDLEITILAASSLLLAAASSSRVFIIDKDFSISHSFDISDPVVILPNPTSDTFVILTSSNELFHLDSSYSLSKIPIKGVETVTWSQKGKQLACGVDGSIIQITIDGTVRNTIPHPPSFPNSRILDIQWIENKVFIINLGFYYIDW